MDDGAHRRAGGGRTDMRKRMKFHEVRYPKIGVSKSGNSEEQSLAMPASAQAASEPTHGEIYIPKETPEEIERRERRENELIRIARMHGSNIPGREDVIEVKNERTHYDGSRTGCNIEDSLIMLTDIKTGFFRACVEKNGGGWYGYPNPQHLERYGLSPYEYNKRKFKEEHIPVVKARESENLVVGLIYRKAYHRATAVSPGFGKSAEILVQECWFKCYLPWTCLERDISRSVEVANNILQELEPEITELAKIVEAKIKAERRLCKAASEYGNDAPFGPDGVPEWVDLPMPQTRDELNRLGALYNEDRAADRRVKEKEDAHDQGKIGPKGSYSLPDVWDRETTLEDLQKRVATGSP